MITLENLRDLSIAFVLIIAISVWAKKAQNTQGFNNANTTYEFHNGKVVQLGTKCNIIRNSLVIEFENLPSNSTILRPPKRIRSIIYHAGQAAKETMSTYIWGIKSSFSASIISLKS